MRPTLDECLPILTMLTHAVRVATGEQLQALMELYSIPQRKRFIARLLDDGFLTCDDLSIRVPKLDAPLLVWQPSEPTPDHAFFAQLLARRATETPWRRTRLFWATRKAIALVGGTSGLNRQPLQVQHDLCTTEAYLRFLESSPNPDECWLGEDALRLVIPRWLTRKRPDAVVLRCMEVPVRIIEAGGVYDANALSHIHRSFSRERIPYELW